jgi:hypothetical protein
MGGGVRLGRKGHEARARFRDRPTGSHCGGHVWRVRGLRAGRHVGGTSRGGKQWSLQLARGVGVEAWKEGSKRSIGSIVYTSQLIKYYSTITNARKQDTVWMT